MQAQVDNELDWAKGDGLLPAIIQHADTHAVLMLGYMNREAFDATQATGLVTFYSRSKQRLWQKGETSGNTLAFISATPDCDADTLLIKAKPAGPVCHCGTRTCFGEPTGSFIAELDAIIASRRDASPDISYTARLFASGTKRLAQKVGEEAVETALAAVANDKPELVNEAADLLYHLQVLLQSRELAIKDVEDELHRRHSAT